MKSRWTDENWLMLMQVYLKKPVGVKSLYSRDMVDLALELHFHPKYLKQKMFRLRRLDTPLVERLWKTYSKDPKKLSREVDTLRNMVGFNNPDTFYEGVEVVESFEKFFRPLAEEPLLTPVMLTLILDLYFRLTPNTMVEETQEIILLAKTLGITPALVVEVMDEYQRCDPYLNRKNGEGRLHAPCQTIWQRYGNGDPADLEALAAQLQKYFD